MVLPVLALAGAAAGAGLSYAGRRSAARSQARDARRRSQRQGMYDLARQHMLQGQADELGERSIQERLRASDFIRDLGTQDHAGAEQARERVSGAIDQASADAGVRTEAGGGDAFSRSLSAALNRHSKGVQHRNALRVDGAGRQHLAEDQRQAGVRESFERVNTNDETEAIRQEHALDQARLEALISALSLTNQGGGTPNSASNLALAGDLLGAAGSGVGAAYGEGAEAGDLLSLFGLGGSEQPTYRPTGGRRRRTR